ncbi:N-acetylmuramoyl-L-alanine amidase [Oceaniglobus roseus]|uniref:N-acetylmuramoyl-L-alanine amidase n=1 Tax=Oceaniglobus roseus TaxID=1737570 RepID=UPI000C7E9B9E|nr:N-acetylmuramoyl-L-alanine amidase [Kandeliimicrobium roseum]
MTLTQRLAPVLAGLVLLCAQPARAEDDLNALARPDLERSEIADFGANLQITLTLSQPVPFRIFTLDAPRRLVIDFSVVDWAGQDIAAIDHSDVVDGVVAGPFHRQWSRVVMNLTEPMALETAGMATGDGGGAAVLKIQLAPTDEKSFAAAAGAPEGARLSLPATAQVAARPSGGAEARPLVVMLDPGHGGIDPGAEAGGVFEADLMLRFALDLRGVLQQNPRFRVVMTRESDVFVPLETRVSAAREAGADVFLSLHADALAEGRASGATVYTLSEEASDEASRVLAERHDRDDLLAGLDLSGQDDVVATVLMDMARLNTTPRSDRLARALVQGLSEQTGNLHKRPRLRAGFSVLKAPDIPSALVELGFLSNSADRTRLRDPAWRQRAAVGIRNALVAWAEEDARKPRLIRP